MNFHWETKMPQSLPVLTHHYISRQPNPIAVAPEMFEAQLRAISAAGFRGISLEEAAGFLGRGRALPGRPCLITFDDGYLDNATYAWPLLEEYGHKGVIFAVTDRLGHGPARPTLGDVRAGRAGEGDLPPVDAPFHVGELGLEERRDLFLSWEEAGILERSGTMRVEPHGHSHASVFHKPEFHTFFKPRRKKRTFDTIEGETLDGRPVWGLPRFAEGPALATRAFIPSDEIYELALREVPQDDREALAFFGDAGNEERLRLKFLAIPKERWGTRESERSYEERVRSDLELSIHAIQNALGRRPISLAWPWGAYSEQARAIARELGIEVFFCTTAGANPSGSAGHVHRFKARPKAGLWLRSRLEIYSRPWLAKAYGRMRG